jgi:hypothetical protein
MTAEPIFIVCNARSGSTLLRYLLDAHPDIACPSEAAIAAISTQLMWLHVQAVSGRIPLETARGQGPSAEIDEAAATARLVIDQIMTNHLERRGKAVWCSKELYTVEYLRGMNKIFPRARYLCLHRHAMDVIASGLEASRWGFCLYGFPPYISPHLDNFVAGLARYWVRRTKDIMVLEDAPSTRTYRVHYEHLVRNPGGTLAGILDFLDVEHDDKVVRQILEEAMDAEHDPGPADRKIAYTSAVQDWSVERGRGIPAVLLDAAPRAEMNALLASLGYPEVTDDWNISSDLIPAGDRSLLNQRDAGAHADQLVHGLVASRLTTYPGPLTPPVKLVAAYGDGKQRHWVIDSKSRTVSQPDPAVRPPHLEVTMRAEVLRDLLIGGLHLESVMRLRMARISGLPEDTSEREILRLIAWLFAG